jgi:hypothetical protein
MGLRVWHPSGRYIDVDDDTSQARLTPDELAGLLRQHVAQWIEEGKFDFAASAVFRYTWHKSDHVAAVANLCMAQIAIARGNPLAARFHLDRAECLGIPAADQDWDQQLLDQSKNYVTEPGERFKPHNTHLSTFTHDILVKCPKCGASGSLQHSGVWSAPTVFTCLNCALRVSRKPGGEPKPYPQFNDLPHEDRLGLELLLKTETRHGWLWAYNKEHLDQLQALIAARFRDDWTEHPIGDSNDHWENYAWAANLPKWILAAKNRDELTHACQRIRQLLPA